MDFHFQFVFLDDRMDANYFRKLLLTVVARVNVNIIMAFNGNAVMNSEGVISGFSVTPPNTDERKVESGIGQLAVRVQHKVTVDFLTYPN